jgi:hypothetical protein
MTNAAVNSRTAFESASTRPVHHLSYWLLAITIVMAFGLVDIAVVALPAMAISLLQVFALAIAFVLMSGGLIFTVWQFED